MVTTIKISGNIDINHLDKMFLLLEEPGKLNTYTLKVLTKFDWKNHKDGIKNLNQVTRIFNTAQNIEVDNTAILDCLCNRLLSATKKHNSSKIRILRFLLIPYLLAKIFGWTVFDRYQKPIRTRIISQPPKSPKVSHVQESELRQVTSHREVVNPETIPQFPKSSEPAQKSELEQPTRHHADFKGDLKKDIGTKVLRIRLTDFAKALKFDVIWGERVNEKQIVDQYVSQLYPKKTAEDIALKMATALNLKPNQLTTIESRQYSNQFRVIILDISSLSTSLDRYEHLARVKETEIIVWTTR